MRRGGVLILLIGLILIVGTVMLYFVMLNPRGPDSSPLQITQSPTDPPKVSIVRARIDIEANTIITDGSQIEVVEIQQNEFDESKNFSNESDVKGQLAIRKITAGQPIEKDDLTEPGLSQQLPTAEAQRARDKAYPFIVNNLSGVSDQIKPGDFVDVVATFIMPRRYSYPKDLTSDGTLTREVIDPLFNTTKTIVQRAQVLKIVRPVVASPDATPEPGADASSTDSSSLPKVDASGKVINPGTETAGETSGSITQGAWTLILAVNDQEVELMEFALSTNSRMVLVLRGAGDSTFEPTIGATFDLLVAEFGVPLPQNLPPNVISINQALTPEPTRTPAPTRVP